MSLKILILGVNGFIGSNLVQNILQEKDWEIYGMDLSDQNLQPFLSNARFHFTRGDITQQPAWIEKHLKECEVVLPLVAIANPATYVQNPLRIFELDFEANLPIIRQCVEYQKRVIFPSTSEVYGMSSDAEFDEEKSNFVLGPTHKERWIYSCSKQLLDRVIYAYGAHQGLKYTLFRPFNWIGPRQDTILGTKPGGARVLPQFISNVLQGRDIELVDGGSQKRCFTYIDDGIFALVKIIENADHCADKRIFNIGNPSNNFSIGELAEMLIAKMRAHPKTAEQANKINIIKTTAQNYYGSGYQDVTARVPAIAKAKKYLGWEPKINMEAAIDKTLNYYFGE